MNHLEEVCFFFENSSLEKKISQKITSIFDGMYSVLHLEQ